MLSKTFRLSMLIVMILIIGSCSSNTDNPSGIAGDVIHQDQLQLLDAFGGETFEIPVGVRHAGDGSGSLYVVEKPGIISVLSGNLDDPRREIFIDIRDKVNSRGNEQGLLGLAFHPDYKNNGKFYVNYTSNVGTVIESYELRLDGSKLGDPASGVIILTFNQPFNNHNGGEVSFGADGYLYIATGDGGSGGDPLGNGQNLDSLLGKILRINVDQTNGDKNYSIPEDNPYYMNKAGYREEIYAYGLRNPWRFSFDKVTGKLWAADVGQNTVEEIDIIEKGHNYGWSTMEGSLCFNPKKGCEQADLSAPIWEYNPENSGASITGGYVYRGKEIPSLVGKYIFADFVDGRIWTLSYDGMNTATAEKLELEEFNITSFGEDEEGELYACLYDGRIVRLSSITE